MLLFTQYYNQAGRFLMQGLPEQGKKDVFQADLTAPFR